MTVDNNQNQDPNQSATQVPQQTQQPSQDTPPSMDVTAGAAPMPTLPAATPAMPTLAPQQAAPQQQNPNAPHWLARALDGVLKTATGGDVYYTDANGQRQVSPQSRGTLGKTLIAATLAGLLAKDEYRWTPYGDVRDYSGTGANAAAAGKNVVEAMRNKPQQVSDQQAEAQTRKLMTLQNNAKLYSLQLQSSQMNHKLQDENAEHAKAFMAPFMEYDSLRTADQPSAVIDKGLTHDQVTGNPKYKLLEQNIVPDGNWITKWSDVTNQMEPEPTYAVLNPDLKEINLPKDVADRLARINSQWQDIHKVVGGNVSIPVNAYVSAMHDNSAVLNGAETLDQLNTVVNGDKATPLTLAALETAVRQGRDSGKNILPALYKLTEAMAGGNIPDQRPDNLLHVLLNAPNGGDVLKLIGLTPEQASQKMEAINNQRIREAEIAKTGGVGDKAIAQPSQVNAVVAAAKQLPAEYQPTILSGINPKGMTVGELEKLKDKVLDTQKHVDDINQKKLTQGGDPVIQSKTANNIIEGDVARLDKITSVRGNARQELMDAIHDEAQRRGLDTTQFGPAALENKSNTWNDYNGNKKGSTGAQIASFNAYLGHTAAAVDAEKRLAGKTLGLTGTPVINIAMDKLGKQLTDDADWKAYTTAIEPVKHEIENFLNAGFAVKAEDAKAMQGILSPDETPARMTAALRQLADTADIRLQAIGQRYLDTMGTTYPNLMSSDSMNTLKRLGFESKALPLSQRLRRGWQNNQPQKVTDKNVAQAFYLAAGKDKAKAQELAKQNGWTF